VNLNWLQPKAWCTYHAPTQQMRDAMSEPIVLTPDQRPRALNVAGFDITVLASDAQTSGYEVFLQAGADGKGSSPHQHPWDESFYVISGEITCGIDDIETVASAGTFVHIPGGSTHWYKFGADGAEIVSMTSQGNASRMYTDFDSESSWENPDRSHFVELAAKHGQHVATPKS
jgi:quercetin dioxygenase-like cupin family protein